VVTSDTFGVGAGGGEGDADAVGGFADAGADL
jgi:hypothetical protein